METKTCSKCKLVKSMDSFGFYKKSKDLHREVCKLCRKLTDPDYSAEWYKRIKLDPERFEAYKEKRRVRSRKRPRPTQENRKRYLKRTFGITEEKYQEMLINQSLTCAICPAKTEDSRLCIDHDHETGRVRGLLCDKCNMAMGLFKESSDNLRRAIEYLNRYKND